jgi:cytochrome c556
MIILKKIMKVIKIFIITLTFSLSFSILSYADQSVEEIIKGRKAMFSENYQNAKKISILLKSKKIEEAKPLMKKISNNYKKLLNYFPENTKEGFKTEALPTIWENSDEFVTLMQKASYDMIKLAKAIDTAEDLRAIQKELMWSNCSACHNRFRAEH